MGYHPANPRPFQNPNSHLLTNPNPTANPQSSPNLELNLSQIYASGDTSSLFPAQGVTKHYFGKSSISKTLPSTKIEEQSAQCPSDKIFVDSTESLREPTAITELAFYSMNLESIKNKYFGKSLQQQSSDQPQDSLFNPRKRGKYKMFNVSERLSIMKYAEQVGIENASEYFGLPKKRLKRWFLTGPLRRKGAGRKTLDPDMEETLVGWMSEYVKKYRKFPVRNAIKTKAKNFSRIREFRASKGWCDKFFKRNEGVIIGMKKFVRNIYNNPVLSQKYEEP